VLSVLLSVSRVKNYALSFSYANFFTIVCACGLKDSNLDLFHSQKLSLHSFCSVSFYTYSRKKFCNVFVLVLVLVDNNNTDKQLVIWCGRWRKSERDLCSKQARDRHITVTRIEHGSTVAFMLAVISPTLSFSD